MSSVRIRVGAGMCYRQSNIWVRVRVRVRLGSVNDTVQLPALSLLFSSTFSRM